MLETVYEFKDVYNRTQSNYIFQYVKNRKLTEIYHSHDFYEIIYFLQGRATQRINGKIMKFNPPCAILLRPSDKHCFLNQTADTVIVSLSVERNEFALIANAFDDSLTDEVNCRAEPKIYSIAGLWPYIDADFEKLALNQTECELKFLLSCFLKLYIDSTKGTNSLPEPLAHALIEMKKTENLQRGIEAFSELSNYSQSHLSRLIKKHFNMTLKRYINELRLQKAYNCIVFTQKPTEDISQELGFSSYSHFNKIFKERFSETPASLRKKNGIWTA